MKGKLLKILIDIDPQFKVIKNDFNLTADSILQCLSKIGVDYECNRLPTNFEDFCDNEIADHIFQKGVIHRGNIVIHTPACSRYELPDFECSSEKLREFVNSYNIEMMFDGDVIFVARESSSITVFHHEGAYVNVFLNKKQKSKGV